MIDWNKATLRWLNDFAAQGVLTTDAELNIRGWNRWLETHSGRRAAEVMGRNLLEVYPELVERGLDRYYREALAGQVRILSQRLHRYLLPLPSGYRSGPMAQSAQIAPLVEEGRVIGAITVIEDVTERVERENALRGSEQCLRSLIEAMAEGVVEIAADGQIVRANPAAERILGLKRSEIEARNYVAPEWEILHPDGTPMPPEEMAGPRAMKEKSLVKDVAMGVKRPDGTISWINVSAAPLINEAGGLDGVVGTFADITERVRAERAVEERRRYLEGVLGAAPDAIATLDAQHRIVEWNPGAEKLFGYSREEAIGQNIDDLITSPAVLEEAAGLTQVVLSGREVPPTETVRYRKDGSPVDVIVAGSPIMVEGEFIGVVAVYTDITARVRIEETLRALALVDELTGLYNRRGFVTLAEQQLKTAHRTKRKMALLFADFNGLKQINDTLGHHEGDLALIETADALRETFRESDIVARVGGDEFVVLAIETNGFPAEILTTRLQGNLGARNAGEGRRYKLSLSVGIARYDPEHPCSLDDLLAQADRAMYEQKRGLG